MSQIDDRLKTLLGHISLNITLSRVEGEVFYIVISLIRAKIELSGLNILVKRIQI